MPPLTAQSDTPPPTEPPKGPPSGASSEQPSSSATATFVASGATAPPAQVKSSTRVAAADTTSQVDSRRQECSTQCERDSGECRSLNRRGKQDCMRAVAFGGSGRLSNTTSVSPSCAFYGQARCDRAFNRDACLARMSSRHSAVRAAGRKYRLAPAGLRGQGARFRQDVPGRAARLPGGVLGEGVIHLLHVVVLLELVDQLHHFRRLRLGQLGRREADVLVLR